MVTRRSHVRKRHGEHEHCRVLVWSIIYHLIFHCSSIMTTSATSRYCYELFDVEPLNWCMITRNSTDESAEYHDVSRLQPASRSTRKTKEKLAIIYNAAAKSCLMVREPYNINCQMSSTFEGTVELGMPVPVNMQHIITAVLQIYQTLSKRQRMEQ